MKKLIVPILLLAPFFSVKSQTFKNLESLKEFVYNTEVKAEKGIQVHQFLDNCIYEHKCGPFAGGAIRSFGIFKGLVLTIDRRTRCNQMSRSQFLPIRFTDKGLIKDHWNYYRIETK